MRHFIVGEILYHMHDLTSMHDLTLCLSVIMIRVFLRSELCNSVGVNVKNHLIPVASRNSSLKGTLYICSLHFNTNSLHFMPKTNEHTSRCWVTVIYYTLLLMESWL